jgi:methionyl-tRNA formyltransferase
MSFPRLVFFGTPPFAATALAALADAGCPVPLVVTQPDRPAGRGQRSVPTAVRTLAESRGLAVDTPITWNPQRGGALTEAAYARLVALEPDLLVVAAYGLLLPQRLLDLPRGIAAAGGARLTAINIHASLLPRWRGAAPVARAIEAGDRETGITLMQMEAGLDTGPMLAREAIPIANDDTSATLTDRLAVLGARMIVDALRDGRSGQVAATPQPADGATYARKLDKREAWLDWTLPAVDLARRVRAFDPAPGAAAMLGQATLKIWQAYAEESFAAPADGAPGTILDCSRDGLRIRCAAGSVLRATLLQRAGGRRLDAAAFCAGAGSLAGARLAAVEQAAT